MILFKKSRPGISNLIKYLGRFGLSSRGGIPMLSRLGITFLVQGLAIGFDSKRRPISERFLFDIEESAKRNQCRPALARYSDDNGWEIWLKLSLEEVVQMTRCMEHERLKKLAASGKSTHH